MLIYAKEHLVGTGEFGVVISTKDIYFQDIAANLGFTATQEKELKKLRNTSIMVNVIHI